MYDLLLKDFMLLSPDFSVKQHMSVAVRGNKIAVVGSSADMNDVQSVKTINGNGKLLMPGLVDGHTHTCQQLLRGSLADEFPMIWVRFLVPFESTLTEDDVYFGALLYCIQAIKSGITSFADSGGRHMHKVVKAAVESGIRASITRSMMDMGRNISEEMLESAEVAIENNDLLFEQYHGAGNGRINIFYGMRQVMTCSPRLITLAAQHARERKTGVHAHLCEHRDEVSFCLQNYKKRPAELLDSCGMLDSNLLTAHNVALSESDITLLAQRKVKLIHCPFANLINHGVPKTPRLLEAGCSVGLGSDGAAYNSIDLFEEMRLLRAAVIANWGLPVFDPVVLTVQKTIALATQGGAAALNLNDGPGVIEPGRIADLIAIDINQPHIQPTNNYTTALLDCVCAHDVTDSIIDGTPVMLDRRILALDENVIMEECAARMKSIRMRTGY
jgi:5-methylthioadenosine/S-adenosylhomocysteine deaminase